MAVVWNFEVIADTYETVEVCTNGDYEYKYLISLYNF